MCLGRKLPQTDQRRDAGSPAPTRAVPSPHSPQSRRPRAVLQPGRAWWPKIRPLIALGDRHRADRPGSYRSSHRLGREENPAGWGRRGSRAAPAPRSPSAARPIASAIWPAKAALPPRPAPAPTFEVNKWKRLSQPPSVARLISAAHLSPHGTKGAQRRGQLRQGFDGGAGWGWAARSARPPPLCTRGPAAGEARAAGRHRRWQEGGRAPPLGDNQPSHLNVLRSAMGRRRPGPRATGRVRGPASLVRALSLPRSRAATRMGPGGSPCTRRGPSSQSARALPAPLGWATGSRWRWRPYQRWRSVPNLRSPCPSYLHFSSQ